MPSQKQKLISDKSNELRKNKFNNVEKLSDRLNKYFWFIFILVTCVKVLLIPTYHSTDFEVHRNWLAITHSLPVKEWYTNAKSQWTLDYPPFFAWFEFLLSQLAPFFDPRIVEVENIGYASFKTKIFQRLTVIVTDTVYACGVKAIGQTFYNEEKSYVTFVLLSLSNIGLLIVDHIHFQYNGFLLGILLLSLSRVTRVSNERHVLQGALWFAVLLNLKHIYIYVAPAFVVWLLRCYCFKDGYYFSRILKLASVVLATLALSFGPFVNQLPQVLSRLFPFKRGLIHAYWAANAWALYTGLDKVLCSIWQRLGWKTIASTASMTGGLVQEYVYAVLPTPTPFATFLITFAFMLPALLLLFIKTNYHRSPYQFIRCVILCGLTSFMFGWHVHEKAILTGIIPLCVLATINDQDAKVFLILSAAGHTALLPLLFKTDLAPLRILLLLFYTILSTATLTDLHKKSLLRIHELLYIVILPLLPIYESFLHELLFSKSLPFLPLAFTSLYCAVGITYSWIYYYFIFYKYDKVKFS